MGFRIRESSRLDSKVIVVTIRRNTATTTAATTTTTTTQRWLKYTNTSPPMVEFYCPDFLPGAITPAYLDVGIYVIPSTPALPNGSRLPMFTYPYGLHGGGAFFYPSSTLHLNEAGAVFPTIFEIDSSKNVNFCTILDTENYIISEIIKLQGVSTTSPSDIHIKLQQLLLYAQKVYEIADDLIKTVPSPPPTTTPILTSIDTIIQAIKTNAATAATAANATNAATTFTPSIYSALDGQVIALFKKSKDLTSQNLTILAQATSAAIATGATAKTVEQAITNTTPPSSWLCPNYKSCFSRDEKFESDTPICYAEHLKMYVLYGEFS